MKPFKKMILVNKLSNKTCEISVFKILASCLLSTVFALPMVANAQSSACAANEIQLTYTFTAPNDWDSGSATLKTTG